ncbi:shematrin-like protein 2 [Anopheles ziemanni]|uniref:shematrin-like protein 2 n=1 Tax=Anopheles coustani TaxID=139045 RepID=UPI0026582C80|nr:shematrin-like protein 2 [Anopheles coustani]XP_058178226.1 shematrin-like protein 2 [Anopheles ziemanni]
MFKFIAIVSCLIAIGMAMPAPDLGQPIAGPESQDNAAVLLVQADDDSGELAVAETAHHGGGYGGYGGYGGGFGGYPYGGYGGGFGGGFGGYGGGFGGYGGGFGGYGGHHHHHGHHHG